MTMHAGHRKRLRERFRQSGLEDFSPHEILELLLCYGRARGDVNPQAHALLDAFGSLRGVLEATPDQLMSVQGIGEESATLIGLMLPMFRRYSACVAEEKVDMRNRENMKAYCAALMAGRRTEQMFVICLDASCKIIACRRITEGSLGQVNAYPRRVIETALNYNAHTVVLCHNHPGGSAEPSVQDVDSTFNLQQLLVKIEVVLQDHIIVSDGDAYSMVEHDELSISGMVWEARRRARGLMKP